MASRPTNRIGIEMLSVNKEGLRLENHVPYTHNYFQKQKN